MEAERKKYDTILAAQNVMIASAVEAERKKYVGMFTLAEASRIFNKTPSPVKDAREAQEKAILEAVTKEREKYEVILAEMGNKSQSPVKGSGQKKAQEKAVQEAVDKVRERYEKMLVEKDGELWERIETDNLQIQNLSEYLEEEIEKRKRTENHLLMVRNQFVAVRDFVLNAGQIVGV